MKAIGGGSLTLLGAAALLLGLLFLLGADGQMRRLVIAAAGIVGGSGSVGLGIKLLSQARAEAPEVLATRILALARVSEGDLSRARIQAETGHLGARIDAAIELLEAQGACHRSAGGADPSWLFPAFQTEVLVRRCEFCKAELPLHEQLASCPNCGGRIATGIERFSDTDDSYSMDE
jgi:predicted RNA-binding Zn-ribbon protein involved in translation (DUF1610 family)